MNGYREFCENEKSIQEILTAIVRSKLEELDSCSINASMVELNQLRIGDSIVN